MKNPTNQAKIEMADKIHDYLINEKRLFSAEVKQEFSEWVDKLVSKTYYGD